MSTEEDPAIEVEKAKSAAFSGLRSLAAGGVGGICAVLTGHPFDLVKVRLQTAEKGVYTSALDVVRKTAAREGLVRGLYSGVSAPLLGVTPMFAVSFWGYDVGKGLVKRFSTVDEKQGFSIAQVSAAGFFSAIPMTIITAPFERIKVLLQLQGQSDTKKYSGPLDVVRQLYKEGGVRSVFRGSFATLARDGPGSAAYFATYEYLKRRLTPEGSDKLSLTAVVTAGGFAGVAMWLLIFPIDTIKSRLQGARERTSVGRVMREVHASSGVKGFFPGVGPAMLRSFPANAATFLGVELAHKAMDKVF